MRRCAVTLVLLLYAAYVGAAQLTPAIQNDELGLTLQSIGYPDALRKDLTSGLTNRILIRVTLQRGDQILRQRAVDIAVRYDLWDELFVLTMALDGVETQARTIANIDEMQAFLRRLQLSRLFATHGLAKTEPLNLTAEILLNPLDRERMEMIRKWVAENSIGPSSLAGPHTDSNVAVAIFNRIFEQYAKGADVTAIWRETSTSRPFRLEELTHERR